MTTRTTTEPTDLAAANATVDELSREVAGRRAKLDAIEAGYAAGKLGLEVLPNLLELAMEWMVLQSDQAAAGTIVLFSWPIRRTPDTRPITSVFHHQES
jgi:hypothetical protein